MAVSPDFLEELRARIPLAGLIGTRVPLQRSGRNWRGCCPFHTEKTPSFYVYDDHYHCFGCGAHGDAVSFLMQTQNLAFMEAVAELARQAGLAVPKPAPEAEAAERRRLALSEVLARAEAAFTRRLFLPEGAHALAYLKERGITEETIRRFGLGYAPKRGALAAELAREGVGLEDMAQAGLLRPSEGGSPAGEFFVERVMFPIRDRRGRVIGFGGRVLGSGQPKYLNGPETPIFSKRRALYGFDLAREEVRLGASLVVVEGYLDVIALHQAGFKGAVAPLGTALSAEQLELLWRLSPVPILCFDGDRAGAGAALRALETALPLLAPSRSLRIAALPEGEDPDSFVRKKGAGAFQLVLDGAEALVDALYRLLRAQAPQGTPEQRAAFRAKLEEAAARIRDRSLAKEYRRALLARYFEEQRRPLRPAPPLPKAATPAPENALAERQRILAAVLLHHPSLLPDVEEAWQSLDLPPWLAAFRQAVLAWSATAEMLDSEALITHLRASGMANVEAQVRAATPFPLPKFAGPDAELTEAQAGWWHIFGLLHRARLDAEVAVAERDFAAEPDLRRQQRLLALVEARARLARGEPDGMGAAV
jgi:DNA primase